jgi:hypothetical protein
LDSSGGLVRYFGGESTVTIGPGIVALRMYCFAYCTALQKVVFESVSTLTDLEDFLFFGCRKVEVVNIPDSLENVHGSAFLDSTVLAISGHRSLRVIGDFLIDVTRSRLIRYFSSSSEIILSRSVEIIGSYSFALSGDLRGLRFEPGSKLTRIGRRAFTRCPRLWSIVIPASVTTIRGGAFAESGIRQISIEDGNEHFCVIGDFLLDITQTSLIAFFGIDVTVTISKKIQVICDSCFLKSKTLSRLNFERDSELRRIERLAFGGCSSLCTIRIPSSIESLEREWFLDSHFQGGSAFDTVQFESYESLWRMIQGDCVDLSGDFDIEVGNGNEEAVISGYCVHGVGSSGLIRLTKQQMSLPPE